jgi:hypothetical protein
MGKKHTTGEDWGKEYIGKNTPVTSSAIMQHQVENKYDNYLLPGLDQNQSRARQQGWGSELVNGIAGAALKIPSNIIGNAAAILDIEDYYNQDDEVGNWVTQKMQEVGESIDSNFEVYQMNPGKALDFGDSAWWMKNMSQVIGSGAEFALTGSGLASITGKALSLVGATGKVGQGINLGINVLALNQAEALVSAQDVYKRSYELNKKKGLSEEESKQNAANAAAYTVNINRMNIPLNLTSSLLFLRTPKATRQLVSNINRGNTLKRLGLEGLQEYGEETINHIAEKEGERRNDGKKYDVYNTVRDVLSAEGIEAGLLGFLGGVSQTGFTEAINEVNGKNKEERERYNEQQRLIQEYDTLHSTIPGQETLKDIVENMMVSASYQNKIYEAEEAGNTGDANRLKDRLLLHQALTAFKNGTTGKLVEMYENLTKDPNAETKLGKDYYDKLVKAKQNIEKWENSYEALHGRFPENKIEPLFTAFSIRDSIEAQEPELISKHVALQNYINESAAKGINMDTIADKVGELAILEKTIDNLKEEYKGVQKDITDILSKDFNPEEFRKKKLESFTKSPETKKKEGEKPVVSPEETGEDSVKDIEEKPTTSDQPSKIDTKKVDTFVKSLKYVKTLDELGMLEKALASYEKGETLNAIKELVDKRRKELTPSTREESVSPTNKDNGKKDSTTTGKPTPSKRLEVKDLPSPIQKLVESIKEASKYIKLNDSGTKYVDERSGKIQKVKLKDLKDKSKVIINNEEYTVQWVTKRPYLLSYSQKPEVRKLIQEAASGGHEFEVEVSSGKLKEYIRVSEHIGNNENFPFPYIDGEGMDSYKKRLDASGIQDKEGALRVASSLIIGSAIDELVRAYFNGEEVTFKKYYNLITDESAFNVFIEQLKKLDEHFKSTNQVVLANDIVLHNDEIGVAGTVDLLTVDKDGVFRIYDMKTMSSNQLENGKYDSTAVFEIVGKKPDGSTKYKVVPGKTQPSNRDKHQKQLSMYRILLARTYGVIAEETAIIPIEVSYKPGDNNTSKADIIQQFIEHTPLDEVNGAKLVDEKEPSVKDYLKPALNAVISAGTASISIIKDKLNQSYEFAEKIFNELVKRGAISTPNDNGESTILKNTDGSEYKPEDSGEEEETKDEGIPESELDITNDDASRTPYRTTNPTFESAVKNKKENEVLWQKFVDEFDGDSSKYLFKVITAANGKEYYDLLDDNQIAWHNKFVAGKDQVYRYDKNGDFVGVYGVKKVSSDSLTLVGDDLVEIQVPLSSLNSDRSKPGESFSKNGSILLLTDKYGEPIIVKNDAGEDRKLYTTMLTRSTKSNGDDVVSRRHIAVDKGLITQEEALDYVNLPKEKREAIDKLYNTDIAQRDKFKADMDKGQVKWLKVSDKVRGKFNKKELGKISERLSESIFDLEFQSPPRNPDGTLFRKDTITGQTLRAGVLYFMKNGRWHPAIARPVNESEIEFMVKQLNNLVQPKTDTEKAANRSIEDTIKAYVYVKSKPPKVRGKHDINITGNSVYFGNVGVDGKPNKEGIKLNFPIGNNPENIVKLELLKSFLKDKFRNSDIKLLTDAKDKNKTVNIAGKEINYRTFLFEGKDPAFKTALPPSSEPVWVNSYVTFSNDRSVQPLEKETSKKVITTPKTSFTKPVDTSGVPDFVTGKKVEKPVVKTSSLKDLGSMRNNQTPSNAVNVPATLIKEMLADTKQAGATPKEARDFALERIETMSHSQIVNEFKTLKCNG